MQPIHWQPPIKLSPSEQVIVKRIKRAKSFVFLREIRHELCDGELQNELKRCTAIALLGTFARHLSRLASLVDIPPPLTPHPD